ncbi:zinc ribbon domain-containing protein [Haladaptatus sp. DYSN1]|uniref:zinc ribbon domain-containing protein n=1 Tax=unclassified Haladaptatus TaxID=2622732 RepID=UPI002405842D|nr:zinc ribbon domain-containing protein [Haladaptatus sp. DYSN1]
MGDKDESAVSPNTLSDALIQRIDSLALSELKSVLSYVEHRIETLRASIVEEIETTATGAVLNIEDYGAYALVRKHPPNLNESGVDTDRVSLYHVRREQQMDGADVLHWAYLGDVQNAEQIQCTSCGGILDKEATVCPHCGAENMDNTESES